MMSLPRINVPHLASQDAIVAWIAANPSPDPAVDAEATDAWLYAFWYMEQDVASQNPDDPPTPYVDWIDDMINDRGHPVSEIARGFVDWQQPSFSF